MKVYFEPNGIGSDGVSVNIYVEPTLDGHAYHFNSLGDKCLFAWANPNKAKCFESEELPLKMWQSIQYGTDHALIPNCIGNEWGVSDLKYRKVNMSEIVAYKEAIEKIDGVKTIDDFKSLYPTIKKSKRVGYKIIRKLFSLCGEKEILPRRGELGIAYMENLLRYNVLLAKIGL